MKRIGIVVALGALLGAQFWLGATTAGAQKLQDRCTSLQCMYTILQRLSVQQSDLLSGYQLDHAHSGFQNASHATYSVQYLYRSNPMRGVGNYLEGPIAPRYAHQTYQDLERQQLNQPEVSRVPCATVGSES